MKYSEQPLQTFRLRNFKAVRDSGVVKFSPLTVFIGNNGSGKSSLIEGLETFQSIVVDGLDEAMNRWRGFENVLNSVNLREELKRKEEGNRRRLVNQVEVTLEHQMQFDFVCKLFRASMSIGIKPETEELAILSEAFFINSRSYIQDGKRQTAWSANLITRDAEGLETDHHLADHISKDLIKPMKFALDQSIFVHQGGYFPQSWQFLNLSPELMMEPRAAKRTGRAYRLLKDGSNIADFLNDILKEDSTVFETIVETLRYVLPYAKDVQTVLTSELGRQRFIQLSEQDFKVPSWLLSTGTLRVLALLAVLRHPNPPPLLCIEEIENGLDPRTLNLIVEEIQRATQSGKTQVVCTTHSPYFLDLVPLSSIIVVERDDSGQPTFIRPDEKALGEWATKFAPGQLYTMSQLTRS